MPQLPSTFLFWVAVASLLCAVAALFGTVPLVLRCRALRAQNRGMREALSAASLQARDVVRLTLAQHWCRAGTLSLDHETWLPIVTTAALAALNVRELDELRALLATRQAASPEGTAIVWGQLLGELDQAMLDAEYVRALASDLLADGSPAWAWDALTLKTREKLALAQARAEQLLTPT